jgi:hypothetical protein
MRSPSPPLSCWCSWPGSLSVENREPALDASDDVPILFAWGGRRTTRREELYEGEARQLLDALSECRRAVLAGQRVLRPASETYALNSDLLRSIDDLADKLNWRTGLFP